MDIMAVIEMISNCVVRRTRYKKTQKRRFRVKKFPFKILPNNYFSSFYSFWIVILKKRPFVCQFASPLDVDIHNTPKVSENVCSRA